jgi:hypothetical protein
MKRFTIFVFALGFVLYVNSFASYAQGKGSNRGPAVTGSHGPDSTHSDHGKDADHADHDKSVTTKEHHEGTFENRIEENPQLKAKLTSLLPTGMDLKTASAGFKNQGQFTAALHVSKNLNIPFADLKAKMTGANSESLGKAIQDLKPTLSATDAKKAADKALDEAKEDEKTKRTT